LWITAAISFFFTIVPSGRGGSIAHAAHLGGLLAGVLWVKLGWHHHFVEFPLVNLFQRFKSPQTRRASEPPGRIDTSSADEFLQTEVDPILEKISAKGLQSLTARERQILEAAREKITRS
jgi:hypothetical protein